MIIPGLLGHAAATVNNTITTTTGNNYNKPNALFERMDAIHVILGTLQRQLPYLLQSAWTKSDMAALHTDDTQIVLASTTTSSSSILVQNLNELVTIQNALTYLILLGPLRAQSALQGALQQLQQLQEQLQQQQNTNKSNKKNNPPALQRPMVQCQLIIPTRNSKNITDANDSIIVPEYVQVKWQVQLVSPALQQQLPSLPGASIASNANRAGGLLQGISKLEFDFSASSNNAKVRRHVLQKLQFDGTTVDAATLGQVVSQAQRLKSLVETTSPDWVKNLVVDGIWQNVAKPWILQSSSEQATARQLPQRSYETTNQLATSQQQSMISTSISSESIVAPLFARVPVNQQSNTTATTNVSSTNSLVAAKNTRSTTYKVIPIDQAQEFLFNQSTVLREEKSRTPTSLFPIPGSSQWTNYAIVHRGIVEFCSTIIPQLATTSNPTLLQAFFTANARLVDTQKTTLVQSAADLQTFYASLAMLRQRTRGSWTMERAQFLKWQTSRNDPRKQLAVVRIQYRVQLAGPIDTTLTGVDLYFVEMIVDDHNAASSEGTIPPSSIRIAKIQQEKLSINNIPGSNGLNQNAATSAEASMFMKSLTSAIFDSRNTGFWKTADDSWLLQVWQRLPLSLVSPSLVASDSTSSMLPSNNFSPEGASRAFFIMSALHQQGNQLVMDPTTSQSPPGLDFMSDSVQLLGYLGEVLLRGKQQYQQNVGLLATSLTKGLESGRIISEKPPSTRVSLTMENRIEFSWTLHLRLSMSGFSPGDFLFQRNGNTENSDMSNPPSGIPLKIQLRSEYVLDPITGDITQHRLLESLVNGQLTPADMLSRFLQGREKSSNTSSNPLGGLSDLIQWILRTRNG